MKFIATYLKEYKKESFFAPFFKMVEAILELLVPLVVAGIIDKGISNRDINMVVQKSVLLMVIAAFGLVVAITAQYFAAKAAIGTATKMRMDLFEKIQSFSFAASEEVGNATLLTRITNDINQVQNGVNMFLRLFLRSPFIVFGALIMATIVDAKVTWIFVLVIALLSVVVVFVMRSTLPGFKRIAEKLELILRSVSENLEGVRVIRAFGNEKAEIEKFNDRADDLYQNQILVGKVNALLNPVTYIMVNIGIILLLWVSGKNVNAGTLSQGEVVALVNYMSQILVELVKLANLIVLLTRAFPSASRVEEVLRKESDERCFVENATDKIDSHEIRFSNVSFTYKDSDEESISDVSFELKEGKSLGIIGGTGSGKSTLVRLMMRSYDATKGDIYLGGQPIGQLSKNVLVNTFGFVPQKASLFAGTISSNLLMANSKATKDDMWDALEAAQAKDFVLEKEGQLDEIVLKNGTNFSGGQKQRLTIARALVKKPGILILDDSSSALDLGTEARLKKAIYNLEWKPSVVIVSQRASSVIDCDEIIVLEDGIVVGQGSHEDLIKSCEVYKEIYASQYEKEASHE